MSSAVASQLVRARCALLSRLHRSFDFRSDLSENSLVVVKKSAVENIDSLKLALILIRPLS